MLTVLISTFSDSFVSLLLTLLGTLSNVSIHNLHSGFAHIPSVLPVPRQEKCSGIVMTEAIRLDCNVIPTGRVTVDASHDPRPRKQCLDSVFYDRPVFYERSLPTAPYSSQNIRVLVMGTQAASARKMLGQPYCAFVKPQAHACAWQPKTSVSLAGHVTDDVSLVTPAAASTRPRLLQART